MATAKSRAVRIKRDRAPRAQTIVATNTIEHARMWEGAPRRLRGGKHRVLNVPPDVYDLRDRSYLPTLSPLEPVVDHRKHVPRIYDQGDEGACTGFATAAVINLLSARHGRPLVASPRFLYENAKRYDEWKGAEYEGSSIRGAMKGFQKHGVCSLAKLPYVERQRFSRLPEDAVAEALKRPLGAYFRVTTSSINDMQSAIAETGALLVSANVHAGWDEPLVSGKGLARIEWSPKVKTDGGHAFALVGYTPEGFIVQNSWDVSWGSRGFALLSYEDWLNNRMDAWVAQMGVGRVDFSRPVSMKPAGGTVGSSTVKDADIRGHYLAIRNGDFDTYGDISSHPGDLDDIAKRIGEAASKQGGAIKLMLWAHGGLVGEDGAAGGVRKMVERLAKEKSGIYPLHFIWHTGFMEEASDLLFGKSPKVAPRVGAAPVQGWLKDKLQNAMDGSLELFARPLGKPIWSEMKTDAHDACHGRDGSGEGPAFRLLDRLNASNLKIEYHLVGHSAGSIFHCELFDWFVKNRVKVKSCSFLAPAVTTKLFQDSIMANDAWLGKFHLHTMPDKDECEDHCGEVPGTSIGIYHKSLLYLVSHSFESETPAPLLGLDKHVRKDMQGSLKETDPAVRQWLADHADCHFERPQLERPTATLHGSFDNDPDTLRVVLERIEG